MKTGLLSVAALLLLVVGCQKPDGAVASVEEGGGKTEVSSPAGFHRIDSKDGSFSLAVPEGWVTMDTNTAEFEEAVKELDARGAGLGSNLRMSASVIRDWGAIKLDEVSTQGNFVTNANVVVTNSAPGSEAEIEKAVAEAKEQMPEGLNAEVTKDMPGGSALHLWGKMKIETIEYEIDQYNLFIGGKSYSVTLSYPLGKSDPELTLKIVNSISVPN